MFSNLPSAEQIATARRIGAIISGLCHIVEGEPRIIQDGREMKASKNFVYTCNTGIKEKDFDEGSAVAIMRVYDLMA